MKQVKKSGPSLLRIDLGDGCAIYPKMKKDKDGKWVVKDPELTRALINSGFQKAAKKLGPPPFHG